MFMFRLSGWGLCWLCLWLSLLLQTDYGLGLGNVMHGLHNYILKSHCTFFPLYFGLAVIVGLLYDGILEVVYVVVRVHYNTLLVEDRMVVYTWILHGS